MKTQIKFIAYAFVCASLMQVTYAASEELKTRTFKTDFISFEISNQWECALDNTEYICRPKENYKKADALIIIAAKIPGKEDNVKAYYEYLKKPKKITDFKGRPLESKVSFIKTKEIQSTQWVDAIHLSSELKNFYTRYLATVKNGIAILVTYSVARSRHKLYAAELNRMVETMKVIAKAPHTEDKRMPAKEKQPSIMVGPETQEKPAQKPPVKIEIQNK